MNEKIKIRPCPFCGSTDVKWTSYMSDNEGTPYNAVCRKCDACGPTVKTKRDDGEILAYKAWNDRHIPVYNPYDEIFERKG